MVDKIEHEQWPPVWTYRLFATVHFLRLFGFLIVILQELSNRVLNPESGGIWLSPGLLPFIFLDLLFGFLLLMRKKIVIFPIMIYVSIIFIPSLPFVITNLYYFFDPLFFAFYIYIFEMFMIAFLGLMWIKREWVHDDQD